MLLCVRERGDALVRQHQGPLTDEVQEVVHRRAMQVYTVYVCEKEN